MKVMTLNINYYMTKHGSWSKRKETILQSLQENQADIVLLQAVKQDPRVGDGLDQAAQLLAQLPEHQFYTYQPATTYQDGSQDGSAILSRYPIEAADYLHLTLLPGLEDPNQRVLLTALINTPAGPLRCFNAHFSWVYEQAKLNIEEALPYMRAFREPAVMAGDFNTSPEVDLLDGLRQEGWMDAWNRLHFDQLGPTFEAPTPTLRIDYIWLNQALAPGLQDIQIISCEGEDQVSRLSDHFGLLASLNYPKE
jgi:endonuclease/exonuclease/phosphatase family metal-dependent hydrolase